MRRLLVRNSIMGKTFFKGHAGLNNKNYQEFRVYCPGVFHVRYEFISYLFTTFHVEVKSGKVPS